MTSISYFRFEQTSIIPYKVEKFNWDPKTKETSVIVTISNYYIHSEANITINLDLDKQTRDPNVYYYFPKNRFSVNEYGYNCNGHYVALHVFPDDKRLENPISRRDPYQWEFDKQAYLDDLCEYTKSLNTQVWDVVERFIIVS